MSTQVSQAPLSTSSTAATNTGAVPASYQSLPSNPSIPTATAATTSLQRPPEPDVTPRNPDEENSAWYEPVRGGYTD